MTRTEALSKRRHRWSEREVKSPELSIRTCLKCGLVMHSCHDYEFVHSAADRGHHWKEFYFEEDPGMRLAVRPECVPTEANADARA